MNLLSTLSKESLNLTTKQAEGLSTFLSFVTGSTAETLSATEFFENSKISILEVKDMGKSGKCQQGHKLRYLYKLKIKDEYSDLYKIVELGIVCAQRVADLTPAEKLLLRGLGRWVNKSGYREILALLGRYQDGQEAWCEFKNSPLYEKVLNTISILDGREASVVKRFDFKKNKAVQSASKLGMIRSATVSAQHLISHELPVPKTIYRRVVDAARRLDSNGSQITDIETRLPITISTIRNESINKSQIGFF